MSDPSQRNDLDTALERLDALVDWERRDRTAAMRQELEPVRDLLARLGRPHLRWRAVHVTGTKGKGSTASWIEAGLAAAGLRVGRYGSPHVERMHERIVIDGREIEDGPLASVLERALRARADAVTAGSPGSISTWFDVVTSAAFLALAEAGVEWAVVEVGLGGRLDSTNAIDAPVCVLTNVGLEHTAVLGDTRAAIAFEKASIAKRGSVLVTGVPPPPDEAGAEALRVASTNGARVVRPDGFEAFRAAPFPERNRALAGLALDELGRAGFTDSAGAPLDFRHLPTRAPVLPGRLENFDVEGVRVVLDGAHVPASVTEVLDTLDASLRRPRPPVAVLALRRDKDLPGVLKALAGRVDRLLGCSVVAGLHFTPEEISGAAAQLGLEAESAASPRSALERALALAGDGGWVLATGSLYLAGALRPTLRARGTACSPSSRTSS